MSQFYVGVTAGSLPPVVPTTFNSQDGNAIPNANILLVNAYDTSENNNNGVTTKGGVNAGDPPGTGATNELDIYITNRQTALASTTDATLTTVLTFAMGATPKTIYVYGNVQAFNASTPASGTYSFSGGYRTDGATATELGVELHDEFEDPVLVSADIFLSTNGNDIIVQVQGVAALNINWNVLLEYRQVV